MEMIHLHSAETGIKKENVVEYNETPVNMENSEVCDLESKIEIVEDMLFKTESSDLSEFLQTTCKDIVDDDDIHYIDLNEENEFRRKEDEKEEEFTNRVTMEEFFPHLSGTRD